MSQGLVAIFVHDINREWTAFSPLSVSPAFMAAPVRSRRSSFLTCLPGWRAAAFGAGAKSSNVPSSTLRPKAQAGSKKRIAGMKKVAAEKDLPADIPFHLVTVAPNLGIGNGDCKKLIADTEATGVRPGAIAIDTTTQALGGSDENGAGMDTLVVDSTALARLGSSYAGFG